MQRKPDKLSTQMKRHVNTIPKETKEYEGNFEHMISTGSTLLDLAISGGRVRGGGVPGGILMEVFGPNQSGKTVLLCEIAGAIQRQSGSIMFHDPEARLNKQFADMFGFSVKDKDYFNSDTVTEVFQAVRGWKPPEKKNTIHAIFADSLAALSTAMEMNDTDGDKMGMRRAKEFSQELRRTCRLLVQNNYLMVCSNQIRENADANSFTKYISPGGMSVGFYSSLRLRTEILKKITKKKEIAGKEVTRVIGVETRFEVFKSSIWKPFHSANLHIIFDYGIDDIRANIQFLKDYTEATTYVLGNTKLGESMDKAIQTVEKQGLEHLLQETVIDLWEEIESKFEVERKPKIR